VAFHDTIYSSGSHGSDLTVRANLVPLFDKYGVDMVFMGDDHDYERTKPQRNNVVVQPGAGTVYVTTGGGGDQLRPVGSSTFTAYAESAFHFTRVTVNVCRDRRRSGWWRWWRRHGVELDPNETPGPSATPEQEAVRREEHGRVWAALRRLPARQREVFVLRHLEGFKTDDVAALLGIASGSVKRHLFRAVHALRRALGEPS